MKHFKFYQTSFGHSCSCCSIKHIHIKPCVVFVSKLHVEWNRRTFLHVHNFKIFVDELYSVIMYEDIISDVISANKNVHQNSVKYTPSYKNLKQSVLIRIQTSTVQIKLLRVGCIIYLCTIQFTEFTVVVQNSKPV